MSLTRHPPKWPCCLMLLLLLHFGWGEVLIANAAPPVLSERIETLLDNRDWDSAISLLQRHLESRPEDWDSRFQLMRLYTLTERSADIQRLLEQTLLTYPGHLESVFLEAAAYVGPMPSLSEAWTASPGLQILISKMERIDSSHPDVNYYRGLLACLGGDSEQAEVALLKMLQQDPIHLPSELALSDIYLERGQIKLAVPLLRQAFDQAPKNPEVLYLLGKLLFQKQSLENALSYLKQSETLDPQERPKRLFWMAQTYQRLSQLETATSYYERTLRYWPERADLWETLGGLYDTLGQAERAMIAYREAYKRNPAILNPFLAKAESSFWRKPLLETLALYQKSHEIAPERVDLLTLLVHIQYRLFQGGLKPLFSTLEARSNELSQYDSTPPLQLAQLQVLTMEQGELSPFVVSEGRALLEETLSPFVQAHAALFLEQPVIAQQRKDLLFLPPNPRQELQRLALSGAWPRLETYRQRWLPEASLQAEINRWTEQEHQKTQALLGVAQQYLALKKPSEALSTLQQVVKRSPLEGKVYLMRAEAELLLGQAQTAHEHLETARRLGLPETEKGHIQRLEKALRMALKRTQAPLPQ